MNNITFLKYRIYKNTGHKNVLEKKNFFCILVFKVQDRGQCKDKSEHHRALQGGNIETEQAKNRWVVRHLLCT